jgi:hypothetical protein
MGSLHHLAYRSRAASLSLTAGGKVRYQLKTPYNNGTTHVVFEPLDFLARLATLVPRPRVNLTRYHGVFAPNSAHSGGHQAGCRLRRVEAFHSAPPVQPHFPLMPRARCPGRGSARPMAARGGNAVVTRNKGDATL